MKNTIIVTLILTIFGLGAYYFFIFNKKETPAIQQSGGEDEYTQATGNVNEYQKNNNEASSTDEFFDNSKTILGQSVEGRDIVAYHYGSGEKEILFVGGIHGGYEWNTALVAYKLMDYLESSPEIIPENVRVTVVPVLNPDGVHKVIGKEGRFSVSDVPEDIKLTIPGRFNAHDIDLNRNFDCEWQKDAVWQDKKVSGGSAPFSEPESSAMASYINENRPTAVIVWYSSADGVFASNCHNGVLPETTKIMNVYADASGYPPHEVFNYYEITGDMVNWLAKKKVPAISVLLKTHSDVEWDKNKKGIDALLKYYGK